MTIITYPETGITELRRMLNEFSDAPRTRVAKPLAEAKLSDVLKSIATTEPQPRVEYPRLLKLALLQTGGLLRDYGKTPNNAEDFQLTASTLCTELRALKAAGTHVETTDYIRATCALEDFLQTLAEKYPACMRDGRHPITNTMEKVNQFMRQHALTDMDIIIGGARSAIAPIVKGQATMLPLHEHNVPISDNDHAFVQHAAIALQEGQKYIGKVLEEFAEDAQPGRNRMVEALSMLPSSTLDEYAAHGSYSIQATLGSMVWDVKRSVQALSELSQSKGNRVLHRRFNDAVNDMIRPACALDL